MALPGCRRPWPTNGSDYTSSALSRPLRPLVTSGCTICGHRYAQWPVDAGASEARVQVGMRHATAAMTRRYAMQRDKGENARLMANVLLPARTA